jgi:FKBP-type peptidyl-prolyl cis-trans isomerase SlpA
MKTINSNSKISIHYCLSLEDGTEIENNYGQQALVCCIGDGSLTSGMEDALIGAKVNDEVEYQISPEQGYGYPNEENIHRLPASDFADDMHIALGQVIAFDGPVEDEEISGTIIAMDSNEVVVDFSHPLAGRNLLFKASVVDISDAPADIQEH